LEEVRLPDRQLNRIGGSVDQGRDRRTQVLDAGQEAALPEEAVIHRDVEAAP
jgi:hypothetical protein